MGNDLSKIELVMTYEGQAKNNLGIFLAHGATMTPFRETDDLVIKLKSICSEIHSITIPGHGKARLTTSSTLDFDLSMGLFTNAIQQKKETYKEGKFGFIGLSLGAMMGMRIEAMFDFTIFIGSGNAFTAESMRRIGWFFSESTYQRFGMIDRMKKHHGEYWTILLQSIKNWFSEEGKLLAQPVKSLVKPSMFILAENDQSFTKESVKFDNEVAIQIVPGDHFSYFSPKILPHTFNHISSFVKNR